MNSEPIDNIVLKSKTIRIAADNINLTSTQVEKVFNLYPEVNFELVPNQSFEHYTDNSKPVNYNKQSHFHNNIAKAILNNVADINILPASDLPYPLPLGLEVVAVLENLQNHLIIVSKKENSHFTELFASHNIRLKFGKVWLVGFGPGDPELLTVKGLNLLQKADVVYYDDLTNKEFLLGFNAEKIYVGKRKGVHSCEQTDINQLLYKSAIEGKMVVRLKGGDPMLFAHGGEEIEFLRKNLIEVNVVPGISAAMAAAAYTGIPLTHRGLASSVTLINGHPPKKLNMPTSGTLVFYMGGSNIQTIAAEAMRKGWASDTPVLLVYNVSNPNQEEFYTTLQQIIDTPIVYKTPLLIIIGKVVNLKHQTFESICAEMNTTACALNDYDGSKAVAV